MNGVPNIPKSIFEEKDIYPIKINQHNDQLDSDHNHNSDRNSDRNSDQFNHFALPHKTTLTIIDHIIILLDIDCHLDPLDINSCFFLK